MDGYRSTETSRARRPRIGLPIAMVALGLLAGIALTIVAVQRVRWFGAPVATNAAAAVRTGNSDFQPAQPLGPGDTAATPVPADPALLATREATLAAQLTGLEVRTATVSEDAVAAGGEAARAESVLVAAAARRAIDRGTALGYLEEQLRVRFGQSQPRAVAIVLQASRAPVTLDDLRQGLDGIGADLATGRSDAHWSDSLDRLLANLVVLRRAGTPSPLPVDRLARARRLLDGGQVDAARGEVAGLPGAGTAANWMTAARRYILVRQALDAIDNAAILGQPVAAPPQPAGTSQPAVKPGPATGPQGANAAVPPMATR